MIQRGRKGEQRRLADPRRFRIGNVACAGRDRLFFVRRQVCIVPVAHACVIFVFFGQRSFHPAW